MTITQIPSSFALSAAIPDFVITTGSYFVALSVDINEEEVFSNVLYPYNGMLTFYDVRSIVEEHMLKYGLSFVSVVITASSPGGGAVTSAFDVVYSSIIIEEYTPTLLSHHFLTTLKAKRTYRDADEALYFFAREGEDVSERYKVTLRYGKIYRTIDVEMGQQQQEENGVSYVMPSYFAVRRAVALMELEGVVDVDPDIANFWDEIVAWTVYVGARSFSFYLEQGKPSISLYFRNAFNVPEYAHLKCESTAKHKVTKSDARIGSSYAKYDVRCVDTQEVESEPLSISEADWLSQLFESRWVRLAAGQRVPEYPPILIEEGDYSVSDAADEPPRCKFTWRYVADRMRIAADSHSRIFTDNYDPTFS